MESLGEESSGNIFGGHYNSETPDLVLEEIHRRPSRIKGVLMVGWRGRRKQKFVSPKTDLKIYWFIGLRLSPTARWGKGDQSEQQGTTHLKRSKKAQ